MTSRFRAWWPAHPEQRIRRSKPSDTAHDTTPRNTSQRAEIVGSVAPSSFQRPIAPTTTPGVRPTRRWLANGTSEMRNLVTERCEVIVAGFHRCGAYTYRCTNSPTLNVAAPVIATLRSTPNSAVSSSRAVSAASLSPGTVNDR